MRGPYLGGMFTPSDGHAEPRAATAAFAEAAARKGARLLTYHAAEAIETTAGQVSAVVTDRGAIQTPVVVNAAGARAMKVARMVGLPLPQLVVRATVAETTPMARVTDAGVWGPGVSFRQKRDGSFYIAGGAQSDYDITLDSFRYLREFMPNYLKNRRLFRLRVGAELRDELAALVPLRRGARRQAEECRVDQTAQHGAGATDRAAARQCCCTYGSSRMGRETGAARQRRA
jgi:glycine/D-amino acid oxidase-like deaminating enzyme